MKTDNGKERSGKESGKKEKDERGREGEEDEDGRMFGERKREFGERERETKPDQPAAYNYCDIRVMDFHVSSSLFLFCLSLSLSNLFL